MAPGPLRGKAIPLLSLVVLFLLGEGAWPQGSQGAVSCQMLSKQSQCLLNRQQGWDVVDCEGSCHGSLLQEMLRGDCLPW